MYFKCINWFTMNSDFIVTGYDINKKKCNLIIEKYKNEIFFSVNKENYNITDAQKIIDLFAYENINIKDFDLCEKKSIYGLNQLYCYRFLLNNSYDRYNIGKFFIEKKKSYKKIPKEDVNQDEDSSDEEEEQEQNEKNISFPFKIEIIYNKTPNTLKLITDLHISFCDWIEFTPYKEREEEGEYLYYVEFEDNDIKKSADQFPNIEIELVNFAFDLETEDLDAEDDTVEFIPSKCEDIIMASICIQKGNDFKHRKIIKLTIAECIPKEIEDKDLNIINVEYIFCENQHDLLIKFFDLIIHYNPDVVCGYNTLTFDWSRILNMCIKYNVDSQYYLNKISSCHNFFPYLKNRVVKYSQTKNFFTNNIHYLEFQGRFQLDLLRYFQRYFPTLPSFKLGFVAKEKLKNQNKLDVDYKFIKTAGKLRREILELKKIELELKKENLENKITENFNRLKTILKQYKCNSFIQDIDELLISLSKAKNWTHVDLIMASAFSKIAKYCIVDSMLCLDLCDKLNILQQCIQLSNIGCITLNDNLNKGPTFRTESLLYKFTYHKDILLNKPDGLFAKLNERSGFQGATVLDPIVDLHYGVSVVDFLSLYPSVIIQNNLCLSTLTTNSKDSLNIKINDEINYKFVKANVRIGIIPEVLILLMKARADYKAELKKCSKESPEYLLLENKIWAVKIVMNSIYGITGSKNDSTLKCIPVSESTTFIGRHLLEDMNPIINSENHKTIYGDTDSNFIKLSESSFPYITYNSKVCTDHISLNLKLKKYSEFEIIVEEENKLPLIDILKHDYSLSKLVFKTIDNIDILDVRASINNRANEISESLCKKITDKFAEDGRGDFVLEHEYTLEKFYITKKKKYIGITYGGKKVEKGTMSVNRRTPLINKISFNNSIDVLFKYPKEEFKNNAILYSLLDDIILCNSSFKPENFILNGGVKTLIENVKTTDSSKIFIDKHNQKFINPKKNDSRFVLRDSVHIATKVAFKVFKRDGVFPENTRINYMYYKDKFRSFTYKAKYFYDNKDFYIILDNKEIKLNFELEHTGRKITLRYNATDKKNITCTIVQTNEVIKNNFDLLKYNKKNKIEEHITEIEIEYFNKNTNPYTYSRNQKVFLDATLEHTVDPLNIIIYENGDMFLNSIKINEPTLKNYFEIKYTYPVCKNKNEFAIDYDFFYHNQDSMKIFKLQYIDPIIDNYESILDVFKINKIDKINIEQVYFKLGQVFNIQLKDFVKGGDDVELYYNYLKPWVDENNKKYNLILSKIKQFKKNVIIQAKKYITLHKLYKFSEPEILLNVIEKLKYDYNINFNVLDFINFYTNEKSKEFLFNHFNLKNNLKSEDTLNYFDKKVKYSLKNQDILEFADRLRIKLKNYYKDDLDQNNFHIFYKNYKFVKGIANDCFLLLSTLKVKIKSYPTVSKEIKNTFKLKSELHFCKS